MDMKTNVPLAASVWATHAPGSIGLTGSVRGIVKYPFGFGSQHLATTSLMGLSESQVNKHTQQ